MTAISPMLANGIDLPLLLLFGVGVFIPLMAFQIGVESAVLARFWQIPFRELARCTFKANCWSLVAGIPVKFFNAWLYSLILPLHLAGFFARYPYAVILGTLGYFLVTWLVEARYSMKWLEREGHAYFRSRVWSGVLLANLATYVVLGPVHYIATRPTHNIREFTADTRWASQPPAQIFYLDTKTRHLMSIFSDGSNPETIVPLPMMDYLVSGDLNLCLFRGQDGFLHFYRRDTGEQRVVWETTERFIMNQVAFSPSGRFVVWFSEAAQLLEVAELQSTNRWPVLLTGTQNKIDLAWSIEEAEFFVSTAQKRMLMQVTPESGLRELDVASNDLSALLPTYGRVNWEALSSSDDKSGANYLTQTHGDLKAWTYLGYGSPFRLYRTNEPEITIVSLAVNPGLLHLSNHAFRFTHPSFLADGRECLFETPNDIYLLDVERKRVGRLAHGHTFVQLTPRYAKHQP
jgi:hypothetical protein